MVPGKLYEYLDAGRPLLALLEPGDEAGALRRARRARDRLAPGDREALVDGARAPLRRWKDRGALAPRGPEWLAEHTRAHLAGRLAAELDALAGETRPRDRAQTAVR